MATFTASQAYSTVQPKSGHIGVHAVTSTISCSGSASISAGDIWRMCKVPNGARILAIQRNFAAGAGNDLVINIGYTINGTDSLSAFGSATAAAGVGFLTKGLPYDVSLSDDAVTQHAFVVITNPTTLTSGTALGTMSLTVFFTNDKT